MKIYGLLLIPLCTWSPSSWFMSDFSAQTAFWILNHSSVPFCPVKPAETLHCFPFPPTSNLLPFSTTRLLFVLTSHQPNWKIVKQTFGSLLEGKKMNATKENRLNKEEKIINQFSWFYDVTNLLVKNELFLNKFNFDRNQGEHFSSVAWRNEFLARFTINLLGN